MWKKIETAPKDGTTLLLCVPGEELDYKAGTRARVLGFYAPKYTLPVHDDVYEPEKFPNYFEFHEESGEWFSKEGFFTCTYENTYGDEIARKITPSHWMPLPEPPKE